jgi:hypothetical protein
MLRLNQESDTGRKEIHWNYNFASNQGRPDRFRSKYSPDDALNQLHNVDDIFPFYEAFFNISDTEDFEVKEILAARIHNILEKLRDIEVNGSGRGGLSLGLIGCLAVLFRLLM